MSKRTMMLFAVLIVGGFAAVVVSVVITGAAIKSSIAGQPEPVVNVDVDAPNDPRVESLLEAIQRISEPNSRCSSVLLGMANARQNFNENPGVKGVAHQQFWQDRYNALTVLGGVWNCDFIPTSIFD